MANGKDLSSEQNISEVLAMLKQSVDADGAKSDAFDEVSPTNADSMTEDDLKQMLRMQYKAFCRMDFRGRPETHICFLFHDQKRIHNQQWNPDQGTLIKEKADPR